VRKNFPTLTELISQLEEHRTQGVKVIEYGLDEFLEVLRWNNSPEGRSQNRQAASLPEAIKYLEVLDSRERTLAIRLFLKAERIYHNAEVVQAWLAGVCQSEGEGR